MVSIAFFPCTFIDGASIVGEVAARLGLRGYTDELVYRDVCEQNDIAPDYMRQLLHGKTPPENRLTLEKEKLVNLCRYHLVKHVLSHGRGMLFYGLLASLFNVGSRTILRLLVYDSRENRIRRAMRYDRVTEQTARKMVRIHDETASGWTEFLHGKTAYDPSLYDIVIKCESLDAGGVSEAIIRHYQERNGRLDKAEQVIERQDMALSIEVERVLLESGYKVAVGVGKGRVVLDIAASAHHFGWLAKDMEERLRSIPGIRHLRIRHLKHPANTFMPLSGGAVPLQMSAAI